MDKTVLEYNFTITMANKYQDLFLKVIKVDSQEISSIEWQELKNWVLSFFLSIDSF